MTEVNQEEEIWEGNPSHILNVLPWIISVLIAVVAVLLVIVLDVKRQIAPPYMDYAIWAAVGVPLTYMIYRYLVIRYEYKQITDKRIKIRKSVWNSGMRPVQLFRIKDLDYDEPIYWKMFGLGNVTLITSDHSDPMVIIRAIRNARELHDLIQEAVTKERKEKGVQEIDYQTA